MKILLENIRELIQCEDAPVDWVAGKKMAEVRSIQNAFLLIHNEIIEEFGPMNRLDLIDIKDDILMEICTIYTRTYSI